MMFFAVLDYLALRARHVLLWGLALGILAGLVAPQMAEALQWAVAPIVAMLLFLAVLRLGPEGVRAGLKGWRQGLLLVLILQLMVPLAVVLAARGLGLEGALLIGIVLVLAAAPITGGPNLAIMSGASGAVALRQLVLGTALLPITALPVFLLVPGLGPASEVISIVLRLLMLIAAAGALGLWLRARGIITGDAPSLRMIDGMATFLLGAIVIVLMGAVGPALVSGLEGWGVLLLVLCLGFGMQGALLFALHRRLPLTEVAALSQAAGNRNVALFLGVLPLGMASELFLFIGLYQIPMYLTPAVMGWVYLRMGLERSAS